MRLLAFIFIVILSGCTSTGGFTDKDKPKEDVYSDSTLGSIKANQDIYREQQRHKGRF
ncbi:hypothetical protein [Moellerella wisconsensis]|uniref:Uncharacterized protein n=2 Tax=Moellerella wisconsensis TaxID=158849 RepID=A0ACD3Y3Y1_9GAMM|nr:hypothetical protein [Moellerella wisconsensis]UNH23003.1 hypothetical protein MNY68_08990 [Moellerella wisconsensis]UNH26141.1 hypothetical protein MNY64_09565 [Moellerella wisconsensis]UNH29556.1 hypothetical protein MNY72_09125 [Moellerella wisconsensis]UNH37696.1 hypothetical protein MNY70_09150 [Moellerella wisconsensis]UNH41247.1 hypothetical protein MNY66_09165 [Moellerella wisconsensis]